MKTLIRLSVLLAALLAAGVPVVCAATQTSDQRITGILKTLAAVHRYGGVAISPDGTRLAWTIDDEDGDRVELAAVDGTQVRPVALGGRFKGCRAEDVRWAPDGKRLALLTNCANGEKHKAQFDIYLVEAGAAKPVAHRLTHLDGFVHDLSWAPGGGELGILYVAGDTHHGGATSATKERVGVIGVSGVQHQCMAAVDAKSGAVHAITPDALYVYEYSWSPDARRVAFVAAPPPGENNWWIAKLYAQATRAGSAAQVLLDPNTVRGALHGLQIALPRWSPDGSRIALIGGLMSDQGATGGDIYVLPSAGGTAKDVTPDIHITPSWLSWTANDRLLVSSIASGSMRISAFTLHDDQAATEAPLLTLASRIDDGSFASALSLAAGHAGFAFVHSSFSEAPEIYAGRFNTDTGGQPNGVAMAPHAVTHLNAAIKPLWGKAVSVEWHNEGYHVQGWLLYPADYDPHTRYPMIVSVHGGPSSAVRPGWPGVGYGAAPLSALGYFVLMPNPRGSFGEGETFTQAVRRDMGYGDLRDMLAGVDTVEKQYPVDDKRLGLTGWSYGGFMSMFVPTQTRRFRAVVAGAGISNWQSYYGQNSIDQWMIPFFGASVYDAPAVYAKSSAINFIKRDKSPTLIIVGERDAECPAPQSFEQWHALRALGVPTQLVVYAGEGHHFVQPKNRRDVLERALAWFQKYLAQH
ncbi:MAG TPA: S9 family peptidase [Gammaproteobacteria bacterium]|nr:S9 family peptidase [Gammaproteobacteria bacterium]